MNPTAELRVLVVEDHGLLAQSLRLALSAEGMTVTVAPLAPADVLAAAESERPAVVLLDLDLGPVGGDGAMLVEPLTQSGARVVVVSGVRDRLRLAGALESGAYGLLSKDVPLDELVEVVHRAGPGARRSGTSRRRSGGSCSRSCGVAGRSAPRSSGRSRH